MARSGARSRDPAFSPGDATPDVRSALHIRARRTLRLCWHCAGGGDRDSNVCVFNAY